MSSGMSEAERRAWVKSWNGNPPPYDGSGDTPGGVDPDPGPQALEAAEQEIARLREALAEKGTSPADAGPDPLGGPTEIDFPDGEMPNVDPSDDDGDDDYEDWHVPELRAEVDRRNSERDPDDVIEPEGKLKGDLISALMEDDAKARGDA